MDSDDVMLKEPRSISKAAFETLVFVTFVLLSIVETVAAIGLSRALGHRFEGGWIAGMGFPNLILSRLAVDRVLKLFGLSRSGKTTERRGRTILELERRAPDDALSPSYEHG